MSNSESSATAPTFLGHPRGLLTIALAEGCERFSYYGMQSLLVLYLIHSLLQPEHVGNVLGFAALRHAIESVRGPLSDGALASQIFGLYAGTVYLTPLIGGLLADRVLGRTRAITLGALLMVAGHFLMAFDVTFVLALGLLLCGVGLFKGNIASQVGELYARDDLRRANAYLIFQNAINLTVIVSPLVCGTLGEKVGWHWGFGMAGVVMLLSLGVYRQGRPHLPPEVPPAQREKVVHAPVTAHEWRALAVLVLLLPVLAAALVGNQQMFNALVVWGEQRLALTWMGWSMPITWLLSADAFVAFTIVTASLLFWRWWATRRREPDEIVKVAAGAAITALAPLLLAAASAFTPPDQRISLAWVLAFIVVNEIGAAQVLPVAMAMYSRVAPARFAGLMLGTFYLCLFLCNLAVGWLGGLLEVMSASAFWALHAAIVAVAAAMLAVAALFGRSVLAPARAPPVGPADGLPAA